MRDSHSTVSSFCLCLFLRVGTPQGLFWINASPTSLWLGKKIRQPCCNLWTLFSGGLLSNSVYSLSKLDG